VEEVLEKGKNCVFLSSAKSGRKGGTIKLNTENADWCNE